MKVVYQSLEEVLTSLSPLDVDWLDDVAANAIAQLAALPKKQSYDKGDIRRLLEDGFTEGILCARLFLGLSKDAMEAELKRMLPTGGTGVKRFKSDPELYLNVLTEMGLPTAMAGAVNSAPVWSDILVERLRSGRGSAISGQKRGRGLEDFTEAFVKDVFGDAYEARCTFAGSGGRSAKCDFAIPSKEQPRIVIESKGYGATGSKMSDIIGDLDAIIDAKRHDTALLFVTDGTTWNARQSDLKKIIERQNDGKIARIYTSKMGEQFREDLMTLKEINGL